MLQPAIFSYAIRSLHPLLQPITLSLDFNSFNFKFNNTNINNDSTEFNHLYIRLQQVIFHAEFMHQTPPSTWHQNSPSSMHSYSHNSLLTFGISVIYIYIYTKLTLFFNMAATFLHALSFYWQTLWEESHWDYASRVPFHLQVESCSTYK